MNVIFNKNERIISGKAAVKGVVGGISGQSRNVNRGSQLGALTGKLMTNQSQLMNP